MGLKLAWTGALYPERLHTCTVRAATCMCWSQDALMYAGSPGHESTRTGSFCLPDTPRSCWRLNERSLA
ncbi:hypothetical protein RSAG8_01503, partial [Rhizoctonia solani AG-8 WAC10335]